MQIRFQPHAVERMQERKITVREVESVIESPDGRIQQSQDKQILYKKLPNRSDNLVAAIVVDRLPGGIVEVITVLINFEVRK